MKFYQMRKSGKIMIFMVMSEVAPHLMEGLQEIMVDIRISPVVDQDRTDFRLGQMNGRAWVDKELGLSPSLLVGQVVVAPLARVQMIFSRIFLGAGWVVVQAFLGLVVHQVPSLVVPVVQQDLKLGLRVLPSLLRPSIHKSLRKK